MRYTLNVIRVFFFTLCLVGGALAWYSHTDWRGNLGACMGIAAGIGALAILVDILLKGFSLRGLTAVTFGLAVGALISWLIGQSPLFDPLSNDRDYAATVYLLRLVIFIITLYISTMIALRGRDEFHLVIPYVRFVPQDVASPLVVADTSALIDGRILGICESHFLGGTLVVPRFVMEELNRIAGSHDPQRQTRGRHGLEVLNALRRVQGLELRIHEVTLEKREQMDEKIIFVARSLKARLLTTDSVLAKLAEFNDVPWLNLNKLAKALHQEVGVGDQLTVELVRQGKESGQALAYLEDGSMVVVNDAGQLIGRTLDVEVVSVLPTAGGKMVFAKPIGQGRPLRVAAEA